MGWNELTPMIMGRCPNRCLCHFVLLFCNSDENLKCSSNTHRGLRERAAVYIFKIRVGWLRFSPRFVYSVVSRLPSPPQTTTIVSSAKSPHTYSAGWEQHNPPESTCLLLVVRSELFKLHLKRRASATMLLVRALTIMHPLPTATEPWSRTQIRILPAMRFLSRSLNREQRTRTCKSTPTKWYTNQN